MSFSVKLPLLKNAQHCHQNAPILTENLLGLYRVLIGGDFDKIIWVGVGGGEEWVLGHCDMAGHVGR